MLFFLFPSPGLSLVAQICLHTGMGKLLSMASITTQLIAFPAPFPFLPVMLPVLCSSSENHTGFLIELKNVTVSGDRTFTT